MDDPFNLNRFLEAQENKYDEVLNELGRGIKSGHWIWYIFPQIKGLGMSDLSCFFSIKSLEEARAYKEHPILGYRLIECTQLVINVEDWPIEKIFGYPDYLKFCSSMTLFCHAGPENQLFKSALDKFYEGKEDPLTVSVITESSEK